MDGTKRREVIRERLEQTSQPISASRFAQEFGVSRQVVVGDIALLRAMGEQIISTARGYRKEQLSELLETKIVVQHTANQTEEELSIIVSFGAEVVDVIVEHELYGQLIGGLHVKTMQEVTAFMDTYQHSTSGLLSELTDGIHLHTIRYQDEETFEKIKKALIEKHIWYVPND